MDPSQWSAYYGYGQGYEAYAYGAAQDPSQYAYAGYAGYAQYPQQVTYLTLNLRIALVPIEENNFIALLMLIG